MCMYVFFYLSSGLIECSCAVRFFLPSPSLHHEFKSYSVHYAFHEWAANWQDMNTHFFLHSSCVYELVPSANIHCHFMTFLWMGSLNPHSEHIHTYTCAPFICVLFSSYLRTQAQAQVHKFDEEKKSNIKRVQTAPNADNISNAHWAVLYFSLFVKISWNAMWLVCARKMRKNKLHHTNKYMYREQLEK